jgi:hypothetical protein
MCWYGREPGHDEELGISLAKRLEELHVDRLEKLHKEFATQLSSYIRTLTLGRVAELVGDPLTDDVRDWLDDQVSGKALVTVRGDIGVSLRMKLKTEVLDLVGYPILHQLRADGVSPRWDSLYGQVKEQLGGAAL